jgi:hypothetical protein
VERCPLEWRGGGSKGHETSDKRTPKRPTAAPSVVDPEIHPSPPDPPASGGGSGGDGLTPSVTGRSPAALQSALPARGPFA